MPSLHEIYDQADRLKDEGKMDEAIAKYQEALAQDESFALAHSALAVVYGRVGKHDEAIKHAQRACEINPQEPFSYTALSVTYQRAYAGTGEQGYIQLAEDAMARARTLQGA
jgi:tetratricopeptide (TPR) repeat protein